MFEGNLLIDGISKVEADVSSYKEQVRRFYFEVLFTKYRCPRCRSRLRINGPSSAVCRCGLRLDPTIAFQRSRCCGTELVKKICHYACSNCGLTVPSLFLFDERIFDAQYFRDKMAKARFARKCRDRQMLHLLADRSGQLWLTGDIDLRELEGLDDDLDLLCDGSIDDSEMYLNELDSEFHIGDYWQHIRGYLSAGETTFESIDELADDARKDRAWRFITLIFMEHEQEVYLSQFGNDILVERA